MGAIAIDIGITEIQHFVSFFILNNNDDYEIFSEPLCYFSLSAGRQKSKILDKMPFVISIEFDFCLTCISSSITLEGFLVFFFCFIDIFDPVKQVFKKGLTIKKFGTIV